MSDSQNIVNGGEKEQISIPTMNALKNDFEKMILSYLESNPMSRDDRKINELELRFGVNDEKSKPLTKKDFDNVIQQLYSAGFETADTNGFHSLRIFSEYKNVEGVIQMGNIRAEVVGVDLIQEYCRTNSIQKTIDLPSTYDSKIKFTQKSPAKNKEGVNIKPIDFKDLNFRVSYQLEQDSTPLNKFIRENVLKNWDEKKKTFRHLNRIQFHHKNKDFPIVADLSIVKRSIGTKPRYIKDKDIYTRPIDIPQYTIQESGVFTNNESYEIELEIINSKVGNGTEYDSVDKIMDVIRKCIRIILSGLQQSNYPITFSERDQTLKSYMKLIHGESHNPSKRVETSDFIGPNSLTLQIENIVENQGDSVIPNIRNNYTVTDKADGERRLLYVNEDGKIYMITTNMAVIFTGTITKKKILFNSLIDGEYIKYNKKHQYINLYAAFDMYYLNGKSIREFGFSKSGDENEDKLRLPILNSYIEQLDAISIINENMKEKEGKKGYCNFTIRMKKFYSSLDSGNIFTACFNIMSKTAENDDLFK